MRKEARKGRAGSEGVATRDGLFGNCHEEKVGDHRSLIPSPAEISHRSSSRLHPKMSALLHQGVESIGVPLSPTLYSISHRVPVCAEARTH
jgi:hypothetical protein